MANVESEWLTGLNIYKSGPDIGPIFVPAGCFFVGLDIVVQEGVGIVDLRFFYRNFQDQSNTQILDWATGYGKQPLPGKDPPISFMAPDDHAIVNLRSAIQAGHGIVDLKIGHRSIKDPSTTEVQSDWQTGLHQYNSGPIKIQDTQILDGGGGLQPPPAANAYGIGIRTAVQYGAGLVDLKMTWGNKQAIPPKHRSQQKKT